MRYPIASEAAAALSAVAVILWLVFFKLTRVPREQRHHFFNMEGYVKDTVRKACGASWAATLVTLMLLGIIGDEWLISVPAEFFLDAAVAVMLGVFSVTFFVMNASSDDEGVAGA